MKQQLLVRNRSRQRAPNRSALERFAFRLLVALARPTADPKGPSQERIDLIVALKCRNPGSGCRKIAQSIRKAFGIDINKDVVRRVLAKHDRPYSGDGRPSWLTSIGHMKDSLWRIGLFQCESILLKTYWVLAAMDQFTRRIVGFGVHPGEVDGIAVCRMFNCSTSVIPESRRAQEAKLDILVSR